MWHWLRPTGFIAILALALLGGVLLGDFNAPAPTLVSTSGLGWEFMMIRWSRPFEITYVMDGDGRFISIKAPELGFHLEADNDRPIDPSDVASKE